MADSFEGFVSLAAGMDAYHNPAMLDDTTAARAINASFRGSLAHTRPSFVEERLLPHGRFQGATKWSRPGGDALVYVASGTVYILDLDTDVLYSVGTVLDVYSQCYFNQADRYLIVQDGSSIPAILEWTTLPELVTPDTTRSVPPGTVSTYADSRIHMVPKVVPGTLTPGAGYVLSGDVFQPWDPKSVLRFTETEYLNEGGVHGLPAELGTIRAMGTLRNAQTGTGVGATLVFAKYGVCAFDFSPPRDTAWGSQQLSQVLFFGSGCDSPWGIQNVNNDVVYRGIEGIRTVGYSSSQGSGSLTNTHLSHPVDTWMGSDGPLLPWVSMAMSADRVFTTVYPSGDVFLGLVSWDVAAGFFAGTGSGGAYDGLWTGDKFRQVVSAMKSGARELYIFSEGPRLLRLDNAARADELRTDRDFADDVVTGTGSTGLVVTNTNSDAVEHPIMARVDTKSFTFGSLQTLKRVDYVDLWFSDLAESLAVEVYIRPHEYPKWVSAASRTLVPGDGTTPHGSLRVRFAVSESPGVCDPSTLTIPVTHYALQASIRWTGRATLERCIIGASVVTEEAPNVCGSPFFGPVLEGDDTAGVELDDFEYLPARPAEPDPGVLVTYDANTTDYVTGAEGRQYKQAGSTLVLRDGTGIRRAGYSITGWNTEAGGGGTSYAVSGNYTIDAAVTLYAVWTAVADYTITYDGNDADYGSVASHPKEHGVGMEVSAQGSLLRTGYYFSSWNTEPTGLGDTYLPGAIFDEDADETLYAQWVEEPWYIAPEDYSIVFVDESWPGYVSAGNTAGTNWVPDRMHWAKYMEDYDPDRVIVFDLGTGWLWPANDGTLPESLRLPPMSLSNIVQLDRLTPAVVLSALIESTIETIWGAGIWTTSSKVHIHVDSSGSMVLSTIEVPLESLVAKFDDGGVTNRTSTNSNERWLRWVVPPTAVPAASQYLIYYESNGATLGSTDATPDLKLASEALVLRGGTDMFKSGYAFDGWNTEADGSGDAYASEASYTANAAATLYAQWVVAPYTITYDSDGGSPTPPAVTEDAGYPIVAPADPGRSGYIFLGWSPTVPATMPAYDVTITATWTPRSYYLVFNVGGGSAVTSLYLEAGAAVPAVTPPTLAGYSFDSWSPALPATVPIGDSAYTAQWTPHDYTISFDVDGGSAVASITQAVDTAVAAPASPTKSGYTFAGWSPAIPTTMPAYDYEHTALWTQTQYTITLDYNDYVTANLDFATQYPGSTVTAPANPTNTGCTFLSWSPAIPATMPSANATHEAQWQYDADWQTYGLEVGLQSTWAMRDLWTDEIVDEFGSNNLVPDDALPISVGSTYGARDEGAGLGAAVGASQQLTASSGIAIDSNEASAFRIMFRSVDVGSVASVRLMTWDVGETGDAFIEVEPTRIAIGLPQAPGTEPNTTYVAVDTSSWGGQWIDLVVQFPVINSAFTVADVYVNGEYLARAGGNAYWSSRSNVFVFGDPTYPVYMDELSIWVGATLTVADIGYMYASDVFLDYKPVLYFDSDGGTAVDPIAERESYPVTAPADPTKSGFTFNGWSPTVPATMPASDVTYTAQWV